jgi:hypothetical protein
MSEVQLERIADLGELLEGQEVVAVSVGHAGEAIALGIDPSDDSIVAGYDVSPGWARFPKSRAERPYGGTIVVHDGENARRVLLDDVAISFPLVQPLPGDEVLLAGVRCKRFADGSHELNGRVYGADGRLRREILLGDGIADLQATTGGEVWVSYFDEGVFGNFGWGVADDAQEPIGAAGLVCFDTEGSRLWEYEPPPGLGPIDDCYALNVAVDAVWAYYYGDFPLVRIEPGGTIRGWQTDIVGAHSLAVAGDRVVLFGGYEDQRGRCLLCEFGNATLDNVTEVRLRLPDGRQYTDDWAVRGRGSALHVFYERVWYRLEAMSL